MLDKSNGIFLLLSRGIDVDHEKGNVVSTNQCHYSGVIMLLHIGLDVCTSRSLIRFLAIIDCFIGDLWPPGFGSTFANCVNTHTDLIDILFRQEIQRFVEFRTIPPTDQMLMAEIAVCSDGNVCSSSN